MKRASIKHLSILLGSTLILMMSACSQKTAEEKGKELATEKIDMAKGIGVALQEKGGAAAESVAGGVGNVFKGLEKGFVQSGKKIVIDPSIESAGLQITRIQESSHGEDGKTHGLDAYILSKTPTKGKLRVIVYDIQEKEIGRTSIEVNRQAEEGNYHSIPLDKKIHLNAISSVAFDYKSIIETAKK